MSPVSENKASVIDTRFTELLQTIEQSAAAAARKTKLLAMGM